uniref:Nuclear pore complex protein Nup214-like n=1 Tax=Dermatophagoides pteronyssinus TaxID=6956 RepID=A0A6P6Y1I8_DERPT|nr:nuclear pore complex protein Nup214-like [Dermatophagoides pteronyssinus]
MATIRQSELTCLKELRFIQLKSYGITPENEDGSGSCLVIEHRNQRVFVCCRNELIYVPLVSLLNFDVWSKSFLNHVDTNISSKTVIKIDEVHISHLLSISRKGYGTKVAVACHSPIKPSTLIYFYNNDSFEETKESTVPFNHFNFSVNTVAKIRFISWHPEMNDNIFACSLTDGSFLIIYIGDYPSKTVVVLSQMNSNDCNVSTFCWSPKGKQIVISHGAASFVQYKFQLNDQNLVLSNGLQETKRIQLPESFQCFHVKNIFWLSTFNFVIIGRYDENSESCYLLVSIPSSKATGADAVMKIVDFGRLILESPTEMNEPFEGNIYPLENLIFMFTNKSSEFAIIGSVSPELTAADNWSEITNDDNYRLMFSEADESLQIRGLSFAHGTPKQFQLSTSVVKGGINQPFVLAYNSYGHLTLFLIDYENGSDFIKVPTVPKCVKPQAPSPVTASNLKPPSKPDPMPITLKSSTSSSLLVKANNQSLPTSTAASNIGSNQTTTLEFHSKQNLLSTSSSGLDQKSLAPESIQYAKSKETQLQRQQLQKKENEIVRNIEDLYYEEILTNIKEFDHQLRQSMHSLRNLLRKTAIGTNEKQERIKFESKFITEMLENILSSYGSLNLDVNDLQTSCLELQYLMEESRTLMERHRDPKYRHILQRRSLDPLTTRRMKDIQSLKDYIEIQLRELNNKFDLEWQEWLQRIKLLGSTSSSPKTSTSLFNHHSTIRVRSPPTRPHTSFIIDEKSNDYDECNIISGGKSKNVTAIVCKALVNNQQLIENLKLQLQDLIKKFVNQQHRTLNGSSSVSSCKDGKDLQDFIRSLGELSLSQSSAVTNLNLTNISVAESKEHYCGEPIIIQCMESGRKISLRNFLENRHSIPIRVCRPVQLGHGSLYTNQKSRFASVLEKIKERRMMMDQKQQKTRTISSSILNDEKNKITENKENKLIQPKLSQQTPATSITTKSDVSIYSATTKPIVTSNSKIQSQQNSSPTIVPTFSFKLPQHENITTTAPISVAKPSLTFSGTLFKQNDTSKSSTSLAEKNDLDKNKTEVPITTSNKETISLTSTTTISSLSTSANIQSSSALSLALKPSFPSFSSSLFGESKQPTVATTTVAVTTSATSTVAVTTSATSTVAVTTSAATTVAVTTVAQQSQPTFNFNNTLSSLSLNPVTTNTSAAVTTTKENSIFGSPFGGNLQSSNPSFSQPLASTSTTSSFFGNSTATGGFGNFTFGGTTQSNNIFGQQQPSTESLLPPQTKTGTLFGQQQQPEKPFQPLANASPPGLSFSSPHSLPTTNVFGGSPLFGSSPTFGSSAIFGSMTAFSGEQTSPMLSAFNNSNHSFGSMAFKNEPMPSFDSLANDNKNTNSSLATGFGQPPGSGGGHFFNSTISQNSDAFTQRRG